MNIKLNTEEDVVRILNKYYLRLVDVGADKVSLHAITEVLDQHGLRDWEVSSMDDDILVVKGTNGYQYSISVTGQLYVMRVKMIVAGKRVAQDLPNLFEFSIDIVNFITSHTVISTDV